MDDEKLIEYVRNYEFIFNVKHPKYMDAAKKDVAWKHISEEMKQPAAACKQRWQGLRDSYRRALNKRKRKFGHATRNVKIWKYEHEMSFLAPYFVKRKTSDSMDYTSHEEEPDDDDTCDIKPDISEIWESSVDNSPSLDNPEGQEDPLSTAPMRKPENTIMVKSASAILMEDQSNLPLHRDHDELDRFFLNISETVKKFPPYQQALAKKYIFTTVSEMELQQLATSTPALHQHQLLNNADVMSPHPSPSS